MGPKEHKEARDFFIAEDGGMHEVIRKSEEFNLSDILEPVECHTKREKLEEDDGGKAEEIGEIDLKDLDLEDTEDLIKVLRESLSKACDHARKLRLAKLKEEKEEAEKAQFNEVTKKIRMITESFIGNGYAPKEAMELTKVLVEKMLRDNECKEGKCN